ncbi:MAG TPA: hypothetical protein VKU41_19780 [Polyangiaceae bacterium]|nr:hypothetical protein [Polyangiaceae bacterium]
MALGDGRFRVGPLAPSRFQLHVSDGVNPHAPGPGHDIINMTAGRTVETSVTVERGGRFAAVCWIRRTNQCLTWG